MNLKNGMKVYADCETAEYLTKGKEYEIINCRGFGNWFDIVNDKGVIINCNFDECPHLNGGNWQIVKPENSQIQIRLKSERKKTIQTHRKNNTNYTSDSAYILALIDADMDKFKNSENE